MGTASREVLWATLATLVALAVLLGLGAWQWQRKAWKEDLIATIAVRSAAAPRGAEFLGRECGPPDAAALPVGCEFARVRLEGTFDNAGERHVFTPSGVEGPGYLVFTPFRPAGFDGWIYVNRGYVPQRLKNPDLRPAGQVEGTVVVEGLLRSRQQRQFFDGPNNPTSNVWLLRDPAELSAAASETAASGQGGKRATAFYVEQLAPRPPGGLPVPSDGKYELPNRHLEYALTWWGLALTLIGVYSAWILSRRRRGERVGA